jgi:hypothetical protein
LIKQAEREMQKTAKKPLLGTKGDLAREVDDEVLCSILSMPKRWPEITASTSQLLLQVEYSSVDLSADGLSLASQCYKLSYQDRINCQPLLRR